jgi:hypothetical protein
MLKHLEQTQVLNEILDNENISEYSSNFDSVFNNDYAQLMTPGTLVISDTDNDNGSDEGQEEIVNTGLGGVSNKFVWKNTDSFPASQETFYDVYGPQFDTAELDVVSAFENIIDIALVQQGGVLSPLPWSLVMDDLLWGLNSNGCYTRTVGYADDIAILINGKYPHTVSEVLQTALCTVQKWYEKTNLSINPNKMVIIPFTRKKEKKGLKESFLLSKTIQLSSEVKYLGITLEKGLTWKNSSIRL